MENDNIKNTDEDLIEPVTTGLSQEEYDTIRNNALEKVKNTRHVWRQKGFYLVCKSCEFPHGSWIGPGKTMVGEQSDGMPILK